MIENMGFLFVISAAVFGAFFLDWLAVGFGWRMLKPFAKILAMMMVIMWTMIAAGWQFDLPLILLLLAQSFGLDGDVFLLFPKKYFIQGLASFLLGHLLYISLLILRFISLAKSGLVPTGLWGIGIFALAAWIAILIVFYWIFGVLPRKKLVKPAMWIAIQVYGWVLSGLVGLSLFSAVVFSEISGGIWLLPFGSFLFLISDSLLAYGRFIRPIKLGQLWVHFTYHLAQFSLAWGFIQFIR